MADEVQEFSDYLNSRSEMFVQMCEQLREDEEALKFLGEDVITQMLFVLADTVNLCQKQAIKLMVLQDHLTEGLSKQDSLIMKDDNIGFSTFKSVKDTEWGKG